MVFVGALLVLVPSIGIGGRLCGFLILALCVGTIVKAAQLCVIVDGSRVSFRQFRKWHRFDSGVHASAEPLSLLIGQARRRVILRAVGTTKAIPLGMFDHDTAEAMVVALTRASD